MGRVGERETILPLSLSPCLPLSLAQADTPALSSGCTARAPMRFMM